MVWRNKIKNYERLAQTIAYTASKGLTTYEEIFQEIRKAFYEVFGPQLNTNKDSINIKFITALTKAQCRILGIKIPD